MITEYVCGEDRVLWNGEWWTVQGTVADEYTDTAPIGDYGLWVTVSEIEDVKLPSEVSA